MTFTAATASAFRNYTNGTGRATRSEYWWFELFIAVLVAAIWVPTYAIGTTSALTIGYVLVGIVGLATLAPHIAVAVRRLHDTGRSGWYVFIAFVPFVGSVILLIWLILPSRDQRP